MSEDEWLDEFFEEKLDLYELLDLRRLEGEELDLDMTDEELVEQSKEIAISGPPDSKEEQIAFVISSLKHQARENPKEFIKELEDSKKRDIEKRLAPYTREEVAPFSKITATINKFSDSQLRIAGEWLDEFHQSTQGKSYGQEYHQLVENELGSDRKVSVSDSSSINDATDVFSDIMNVYDEGYPLPVALYRISKGEDPRNADLTSMGLKNSLTELEDTDFNAIPAHIDYDLRNAVKHGDVLINPHEMNIQIEGGETEYSANELEEAVNNALLAIDYMEVIDTFVSLTDYKRGFDFLE